MKALFAASMNTGLYVTLFSQCVKPILLYGSEVWSVEY